MIYLRRLSLFSRRHLAARAGLLSFGVAMGLGIGMGALLGSAAGRKQSRAAKTAVGEALEIGNSLDHGLDESRKALDFLASLPSVYEARGSEAKAFAKFLETYPEFSYVGLTEAPRHRGSRRPDGPRDVRLSRRVGETDRKVYAVLRGDWPTRALRSNERFGFGDNDAATLLMTEGGVRSLSVGASPAWADLQRLAPKTTARLRWSDGETYLTGVRWLETRSRKSVRYAVVSGVPNSAIAARAARERRMGLGFGVFLGIVSGTVAWVGIARSTRRLRALNETLEGRVQRRTAELQAAESSFRGIFENVPLGLYQCDPQGRFLRVNPTLATTLGFRDPSGLMEGLGSLQAIGEIEARAAFLERLRTEGEVRGTTTLAVRADGRHVWLAESARAVCGPNGEVALIEGAMHDVTAQRELENQLRRIGSTDPLTGLLNRRGLEEAIKAAELPVSFIILDLDEFKRFNDTYGHPAGDRALQTVAEAIRRHVREGDTAARSGGEEFVVVLSRTDSDAAHRVAEGLREAVSRCEVLDTRLTVSGGVATAATPETVREALAAADRALYVAKGAGRDQIVVNPVKLA